MDWRERVEVNPQRQIGGQSISQSFYYAVIKIEFTRLARKSQDVKQHNEGKVREFVHPIRSRQLFCVEKCPFVSLFRFVYK